MTVTRDDRQQFLSRLSVRQPPGMLGVLSSVPLCGEDDAAHGTCPDASRVGTSSVKSGAGPAPFALSGPVYLTGPYNGAPFGLSIAIRAIAGPFDLGTVVVRAAIHVDPTDSHLTIDADPLPQVLQGIPLRLREVKVVVDRAGFIFNPSTCDPLAIHGTLTAVDGTVQEADAPFQATGCGDLPFSPTLSATADGKTSEAERRRPEGHADPADRAGERQVGVGAAAQAPDRARLDGHRGVPRGDVRLERRRAAPTRGSAPSTPRRRCSAGRSTARSTSSRTARACRRSRR